MTLTSQILFSAGFGILGAILRFSFELFKLTQVNSVIRVRGLLLYGAVILITGIASGILLDYGWIGSFIAGYAGLDLIEGIHSQFKKSKIKVSNR